MLSFPASLTVPVKNIRCSNATAASNNPVAITLAATTGVRYVIHNIQWSYSAAPTGGKLTVQVGAGPTTVLDLDITAAGPGGYNLVIPGGMSEQIIVGLAAGGSTVGKLNIQYSVNSD